MNEVATFSTDVKFDPFVKIVLTQAAWIISLERTRNDGEIMDNLEELADAQCLWLSHLAMLKNGGLLSGEAKHQALTEDGIGAQHHSAHWALAMGYRVEIDPIVNLFHSQPGRRAKSPLTAPGNHNNTPPAEGKFEKTFDALAGLGALENTVTKPALLSTKVSSGACSAGATWAPSAESVNPTRQTGSVKIRWQSRNIKLLR